MIRYLSVLVIAFAACSNLPKISVCDGFEEGCEIEDMRKVVDLSGVDTAGVDLASTPADMTLCNVGWCEGNVSHNLVWSFLRNQCESFSTACAISCVEVNGVSRCTQAPDMTLSCRQKIPDVESCRQIQNPTDRAVCIGRVTAGDATLDWLTLCVNVNCPKGTLITNACAEPNCSPQCCDALKACK